MRDRGARGILPNSSYTEGYLKGYEDGLGEAYTEVEKLTHRGLTGREIGLRVKAVIGTIYQKIDAKRHALASAAPAVLPSQQMPAQREALFSPQDGFSYLVKEGRPDRALRLFSMVTARKISGLVICRTNPDFIRNSLKEQGTKILWLTRPEEKKGTEGIVSPDLSNLQVTVRQFMDKSPKCAILIDGLAYLIHQNDFESVLRLVQSLRDDIMVKKGILFITVDPGAMKPDEYKMLEGEMQPV